MASRKKIPNVTTVSVFDVEQCQNYNALQLNCQQFSQKKEKSRNADSLSEPRKRCKFDIDFEELPGSNWHYTCPFGNCIFSNYVFGFETRAARNEHMLECPYRGDKLHLYVPTDGQMPSAKLIDELVDGFSEPNLKHMLKSLFLKSAGPDLKACISLNTTNSEARKILDQYSSEAKKDLSLGGSGQYMAEYNPIQSSTNENKYGFFDGESSGGQWPNAEKCPNNESNMVENNWIMNGKYYEKLGGYETMGINNGNIVSSSRGLDGQFCAKYSASDHSDNNIIGNAGSYCQLSPFDGNGTMNPQGKVYEAGINNNPLLKDVASTQEGFQPGVIDEFLNDKSYLMDDDICLE